MDLHPMRTLVKVIVILCPRNHPELGVNQALVKIVFVIWEKS